MATKKSSNNKRTKSKRRSYRTKAQKQEKARRDSIRDEIILIVTFILSILLLLSNFDLSGKVGEAISKVTFGLFGFIGHLMPIILFCLVVFIVANKGNKVAYGKTISFLILMASLSAFIQLLSSNKTYETLGRYYEVSSVNKSGGGVIGGSLLQLIHPQFGTVGSYVIIIGIIMISLLFLTGKTLFTYMAKKGRKSINEFRQEQLAKIDRSEEKDFINNKITSETSNSKRNSSPRTFLIKDKIKNFTSKKQENTVKKQEESQQNINQESGQNQNNLNQGKQVFSMEEIKPEVVDLFDIPIHRAETHNDDIFDDTDINEKESNTDNKSTTSNRKSKENEKSTTSTRKSLQNGKSSDGDLEKLQLDQSIDEKKKYIFPPNTLLMKPQRKTKVVSDSTLKQTALKLQETLESFGVGVTINNVSCGPSVTRYELQPEQGVKVSKITSLADDIKLNLAVSDIDRKSVV